MAIVFNADNHSYKSIDPQEVIDWMSVTNFVSRFKQKFDADKQAAKSAKVSKIFMRATLSSHGPTGCRHRDKPRDGVHRKASHTNLTPVRNIPAYTMR